MQNVLKGPGASSPLHWQVEAGCFLEKVGEGGKNSKLVFVLAVGIYIRIIATIRPNTGLFCLSFFFFLQFNFVWLLYCLTALCANKRIYRTPVVIFWLDYSCVHMSLSICHEVRYPHKYCGTTSVLYWHLQHKNFTHMHHIAGFGI